MTPSGSGCPVTRQAEHCQTPSQQPVPACSQLALVPQLSLPGDHRGWLHAGPRGCCRCRMSEAPFPWESVLGHRQGMCLPPCQLQHSHSVTSAGLAEISMKDVTVENVSVTSGWQSGFSTKIRTHAKTLDFLLSSPFPSRTRLECAVGNLHFS